MATVKRFSITLPDAVNADLERWADIKGQPKAGICAYLIERGVETAKDKGELPRQPVEPEPDTPVDQSESDRIVLTYLFSKGKNCKKPLNSEIYAFCESRGLEVDLVKAQIDAKAKECCEAK